MFQLQLNLSSDFDFNFFLWAIVGLSVYHAAFVCEAIRSGVNTVPLGQAEAARAIGLSFLPAARMIILPQAFRGAVAPLGNMLIALTKNTTVATAASVAEAAGLMKTMIEFRPDVIMAIFATFAAGFIIIVIPDRPIDHVALQKAGGGTMSVKQSVLFDAPGPRPGPDHCQPTSSAS